jgi:hypothetical protein
MVQFLKKVSTASRIRDKNHQKHKLPGNAYDENAFEFSWFFSHYPERHNTSSPGLTG